MIHSDYPYIRRHFLNPQSEERLYAFLRLPCSPADGLSEKRITEKITHYIQFCKRNNFGTVIPCFATAETKPEDFSLERFRFCYDLLLSLAQQAKIHVEQYFQILAFQLLALNNLRIFYYLHLISDPNQ